MLHEFFTSRIRGTGRSNRRERRKRAELRTEVLQLEERCMMAGGVPVPASQVNNPKLRVDLKSIFWNGGAPIVPVKDGGVAGLPSPETARAVKTITLTNYSNEMIYPFLRSANTGKAQGKYYDPQDLHDKEFREYVGYTLGVGNNTQYFLGLPPHATIKFQVPLVLWDGTHITLATDGTNLTTSKGPGSELFEYKDDAKISFAQTAKIDGSVWVRGSANYPDRPDFRPKPMVMFYYSPTPKAVGDDAPAQLVETTFRDPFLARLGVTDTSQTFPEASYDVSYVNTLHAPVALAATEVPITTGSLKDNNLRYYPPLSDWGWNGSDRHLATFNPLVKEFVANVGKARIGQYFGGKGWPRYFNPQKDKFVVIPSGANIFDNSPLDTRNPPQVVHTSHYDSNRWILSSSGEGAIMAGANGTAQTGTGTKREIALNFGKPEDRIAFVQNVNSMEASKQPIYVTISGNNAYPGVLGEFKEYDPSSSVVSYTVTSPGSGYDKEHTKLVISPPDLKGGVQAKGEINFGPNGSIAGIGILKEWGGSGYTKAPTITIVSTNGKGKGAKAVAAITGGTVTVELADGKSLPTTGQSYVFKRIATDYATTDITNLWYSWAQYYVNAIAEKYKNFQPVKLEGELVKKKIGLTGPFLTNQITLKSVPTNLEVGMTVSAPKGLPKGATVLKIVGNTVYLSQIPSADTPANQVYTFGLPTMSALPSSPYTQPYKLSFDINKLPKVPFTPDPTAFAGQIFEAMAVEATAPFEKPPANYLPNTMYTVANVIKFNAEIPTNNKNGWTDTVIAEVRDIVKSILRGVVDYVADPNQSHWYPNPATGVRGTEINGKPAHFNVFNLDPYVWFVHEVAGLSGYGFSVDDDVANPIAPGPVDRNGNPDNRPNDIQIGFAGIKGEGAKPFKNQEQWFPTTKFGSFTALAKVGHETVERNGKKVTIPILTFVRSDQEPNPLRALNMITLPGDGQLGATVTAPGNPGVFAPGTTAIFFPNGVDVPTKPNLELSKEPLAVPERPILVKFDADPTHAAVLRGLRLGANPRIRPRIHF